MLDRMIDHIPANIGISSIEKYAAIVTAGFLSAAMVSILLISRCSETGGSYQVLTSPNSLSVMQTAPLVPWRAHGVSGD